MGTGRVLAAACLSVTGLAACVPAPVPVAQAERQCLYDARSALAPRTQVAIGIGTGGRVAAGLSTDFSADYLSGRTPDQAFDNCVRRRSGQAPTKPLSAQPGWLG